MASPVCNAIRTANGDGLVAPSSRCDSTAAVTASTADENAAQKPSPPVANT